MMPSVTSSLLYHCIQSGLPRYDGFDSVSSQAYGWIERTLGIFRIQIIVYMLNVFATHF